jgi:hypothetical protein
MREYRPSNHVPLTGLVLLITAAIVGGLGLGVITYFVSREIYLVVLFPILLGLAGGALTAAAVQAGKIRSPVIAGVFGVLTVLILYGVYRFADYYWGFRGDLREELEKEWGQELSDAEYQEMEDFALELSTDSKGFVGYTKLTAQEGITISRATRPSGNGLTLKDSVAYGYWGIEILALMYFGWTTPYRRAKKPFSEQTGEWFGSAETIGTLPPQAVPVFVDLVQREQFSQAGALVVLQGGPPPRTDVAFYRNATPDTDHVLVTQQVTLRRSNMDTKDLRHWVITPAQLAALQSAVQTTSAAHSESQ